MLCWMSLVMLCLISFLTIGRLIQHFLLQLISAMQRK